MRILVTGSSGFVGRYLVEELRAHGHEPIGWDATPSTPPLGVPEYEGDITDAKALRADLAATQPEACIHLAGIAFVPMGWSDPERVMRVNVNGTLNLLEAVRHACPDARVLVVTSAEVYGRDPRRDPVKESDALLPSSLYGVSKVAADRATLLYHRQYGMHTMTARPQNHIGPGQSRLFVVSSFAKQLIALKQKGGAGAVRVGNLDSCRDFTDVRDVVRAYRLLIEEGHSGEAYNIATGHAVPIRDMLDRLCAHAGMQPDIEIDPDLYRPTDQPVPMNTEKIAAHTAWAPIIPLQQTLKDIYEDLAAHP